MEDSLEALLVLGVTSPTEGEIDVPSDTSEVAGESRLSDFAVVSDAGDDIGELNFCLGLTDTGSFVLLSIPVLDFFALVATGDTVCPSVTILRSVTSTFTLRAGPISNVFQKDNSDARLTYRQSTCLPLVILT